MGTGTDFNSVVVKPWQILSVIQFIFLVVCFVKIYNLEGDRSLYKSEESTQSLPSGTFEQVENVVEKLVNLEKKFEKQVQTLPLELVLTYDVRPRESTSAKPKEFAEAIKVVDNSYGSPHIPVEHYEKVAPVEHNEKVAPVESYVIKKEDSIDFDKLCLPVKNFKYTSYYESLGWFNVPDEEWNIMKRYHAMTRYNQVECTDCFKKSMGGYTNFNWKPSFTCPYPTLRIGRHDGGKTICHPCRLREAKKNCLVYSVGSHGKWEFEESVLEWNSDCEIHTFDIDSYEAKLGAHFHNFGLSYGDYTDSDGHIFKTFQTIVKELGNENRVINILKIDCEGCEFQVFEQFWKANIKIQQIIIEVHFGRTNETRTQLFMDEMQNHGYVMIFKEPNTYGSQGRFAEITWLKFDETVFH